MNGRQTSYCFLFPFTSGLLPTTMASVHQQILPKITDKHHLREAKLNKNEKSAAAGAGLRTFRRQRRETRQHVRTVFETSLSWQLASGHHHPATMLSVLRLMRPSPHRQREEKIFAPERSKQRHLVMRSLEKITSFDFA